MKRKRKKRTRLSVSLFPFLAVLICTLGVLIVMLVMAAKSADMHAEKSQSEDDQENQSQIDELQRTLDLRSVLVEGMELVRPDTVARLNESRANRSHVENDIRKLKKELQRLNLEVAELFQSPERQMGGQEEFSVEAAALVLAGLEEEIETAELELSKTRELALESGPSKYLIVPYKGGSGTFRRPIFIECTQNAITFQPSGIEIAKREFTLPLVPGNQLDSALLAIREYWRRYDLAGTEGNAYPLIVIRPNGAETFVLARQAMKSWDDEFGYELVESGKKLEFGKSDPQLDAVIRDAIKEAGKRQQVRRARIAIQNRAVRARLARNGSPQSQPGLTASGPYGGFVSSTNGRPERQFGSGDDSGEGDASFVSYHSQEQRSDRYGNSTDGNMNASSGSEAGSESGQASEAARAGGGDGNAGLGNPNADQCVAKTRGVNWALPTQTSGGTPYLRPIRIHCGPDFLEIRDSQGELKRIPMSRNTADAIDPLVEEVWKLIDSWGISGASSYWKPQLRFTILPGGERRFEQLKGLLFQSGIVVKEMKQ